MKIENEVKYQIKNVSKIKENLSSLNFSLIENIHQEDYYFSPPHKNFFGTKKYYLRLRRNDSEGIFAYHVVLNNLQTKEWEIKIDDFKTLLTILKLLDFKIDCIIKKDRLIYKKKDIKIMIDKVKELGNFVEIEYCGKLTKEVQKQFAFLVRTLQLKEKNLISGVGYPDLLIKKL